MQYALLIYEDETLYGPGKKGPAILEIVSRHIAFNRELGAKRVGGSGLAATSSATTIRTKGGKHSVHDGPFAEAKEQLGGEWAHRGRARRSTRLGRALHWMGCGGVKHVLVLNPNCRRTSPHNQRMWTTTR